MFGSMEKILDPGWEEVNIHQTQYFMSSDLLPKYVWSLES